MFNSNFEVMTSSVVVDNVWINYEGTAVVDPVNTGDRWLHPNTNSAQLHDEHVDSQLMMDGDRIQSVVKGLRSQLAGRLPETSNPPALTALFTDGCYFSPSNCGIGGFRGVPAYKNTPAGMVAVFGALPGLGDGLAPQITSMIQSNVLPNKSIGQINDEIADHERMKGLLWHFKGEARRPN